MCFFKKFKMKGKNIDINEPNTEDIEWIKNKLKRRASLMEIGGFQPDENLDSSWFGKVLLSLPGETWPTTNGEPMHALCQINVTKLPFIPEGLQDIQFITVFIDPNELPFDNQNGDYWCLRAYQNIDNLVPLEQIRTDSLIKPMPMKGKLVEEDYPCWEDYEIFKNKNQDYALPKRMEDNFDEYFSNASGFKLGGWATLIQSEIYWAPHNQHPSAPEFIFQIGSVNECNFMWGDNGVGYFGRGTNEGHEHEWAIEWQCY